MNPFRFAFPIALLLALAACGGASDSRHAHGDGEEHADDHADEARKGAHGGRLLEKDGHAVELAIVEDGAPARLRAWLYRGGKPLPPSAGALRVRLTRLGGAVEEHVLTPRPDGSLGADGEIAEPHSFDVQAIARLDGKELRWEWPSYEGRTRIVAEVAAQSGIEVAPVAAGEIADEHEVQGLLTPVEGRVAQVAARFPGPVRRLDAGIGDRVRRGQTLALIESNLSLTPYALTAPIDGVVLARNGAVGAIAGEGAALFEIADLSRLWVDLHVFGADAQHLRAGLPIEVTRLSDGATARSDIERILPGTATASQSTIARAVLDNRDGQWRPGAAVRARVTVERQPAGRVVPLSALQRLDGREVAFVRVGDVYEARPLELGRRDAQRAEVLSGLAVGEEVVVAQSYLIKADIEKSGVSHEH
ncbi:efflux RND transporter periplasmic adaptor subunit [Pseudoxanthomonas mexicana]|uniref:efflux RND transporter periplasmic adaptor subunit n=1 Tax=Pseudoxanthomonas mexicana TaxID=128785 RepID=UPI00398AB680